MNEAVMNAVLEAANEQLSGYKKLSSQNDKIVEQIISVIDDSTLLGAAYDCMSEAGKERFKRKLIKILEGVAYG